MNANRMELTLTRSTAQRKNPRLVIFKIEGRPGGSVQFFRTLFAKEVPATLTLSGESFAEPKVKLTAAERKLLPKPTPAEKLAKMEQRIAKMKAAIAAAPTEQSAAPAPPAPTTRSAKGRK